MKSFAILSLGALVAAQQTSFPSDFNSCAVGCYTRMFATAASALGCNQGDAECYCNKPRFGYGIRDCGMEACGMSQASLMISYGIGYCTGVITSGTPTAVVALTGGSPSVTPLSSSGSGSGSATTTVTSTASGSGSGSGSASSSAYTTSRVSTTIISAVPITVISGDSTSTGSGTSTITTEGSTTLYTPVGGAGGASGSSSSSGARASASSKASSASSAASGAASSATSGAGAAASSASSAVAGSSSSSSGLAPIATAGSFLGAAALGAAALLL